MFNTLLLWWLQTSALKLHSSCSYTIVTKLHKLHMYTISHMVVASIATKKPNCKAICKSSHFLTMKIQKTNKTQSAKNIVLN